jgi:hypothetical protein
MNRALLIQLWIFAIGFLFSNLHKRTFDPVFRSLIALPVGWAIFGISATVVYGVYFGTASQVALLCVLALLTLAFLIGNIISRSLSKESVVLAAVSLLVLAGICLYVESLRIVTMSPDSSYLARYGQNIGLGYYEGSRMVFSMWGPFVPFIHSLTNLLGQKLFWQYQPVISLHLIAIVFYTVYSIVRERAPVLHSSVAATLLVSLMALSDIFLFHVFYIHVNLISALYMYLCVFALSKVQQEPGKAYASLALLSLIAFSLVRIEAPLFAIAILLVTTFRWQGWAYGIRLRLIMPYTLILVVWYARVYFMLPDHPDLLTERLTIAFVLVFVGFGLFAVVSGVEVLRSIVNQTHVFVVIGLLLLGIIATIVKPQHMATSFRSMVRNALVAGDWGLTWYVIAFVATELYLICRHSIERRWLFVVLVTYVLLVYDLTYFTEAYRIAASDSGNRLILQAVPLAVLYLSTGVPEMLKTFEKC